MSPSSLGSTIRFISKILYESFAVLLPQPYSQTTISIGGQFLFSCKFKYIPIIIKPTTLSSRESTRPVTGQQSHPASPHLLDTGLSSQLNQVAAFLIIFLKKRQQQYSDLPSQDIASVIITIRTFFTNISHQFDNFFRNLTTSTK